MMNVNIEDVIESLCNQISVLTKDNAILTSFIKTLEAEIESLKTANIPAAVRDENNATQVKEEGN